MRGFVTSYIHIIAIIFFMAICGLSVGQSHAKTGETKKYGKISLYNDTTSFEFQQLKAKLDAYYSGQVARGFNGSVLIG